MKNVGATAKGLENFLKNKRHKLELMYRKVEVRSAKLTLAACDQQHLCAGGKMKK